MSLKKINDLVSNANNSIKSWRNQFDEIKAKAGMIAQSQSISTLSYERSHRKSKKCNNELYVNQRLSNLEQTTKSLIFLIKI